MIGHPYAFILFNIAVIILLALDLGLFHRKSHVISLRESILWSIIWTALAFAFNLLILYWHGYDTAMAFTAGYLIERALSIDNLFVFLLIFTYFEVPKVHQYKVLFWGIFVALLMRAFFIVTGIALVERFEWIIYVFGAFLIYTGIKIALGKDAKVSPERNPVVKIARKIIPATDHYVEGNFFTRIGGKIFATPLFIVLIAVEMTDLVFAVDSIPAVLAISLDPFVVYTSNIFAILGLRALYFALAACAQMFHYLTYGITSILIFVGAKMLVSDFISIPVGIALGVIGLILIASVVASILRPARQSPSETGANLAEE